MIILVISADSMNRTIIRVIPKKQLNNEFKNDVYIRIAGLEITKNKPPESSLVRRPGEDRPGTAHILYHTNG
jgi:hypothetical protein